MGKSASGYFNVRNGIGGTRQGDDGPSGESSAHRTVYGKFTTKLNEDAQGKHIPGHKNYDPKKSPLSISMTHAQELTDKFGGTGRKLPNQSREVVNFHEIIGTFIDRNTDERLATSYGTIHYGKRGCHIVPANPNQY